MVKGNVTLWFKDYPVFSLRLWHSGMDVFGARRGPYLGRWDERATVHLCPRCQVTLVAALSDRR